MTSSLWGPAFINGCPAKGLQEFIAARLAHYAAAGEVKYASPRRAHKKVVVYCTYGGAHTGVNEAIPAVKFMGQLFDHLGFEIVAEWYYIGRYPAQGRMKDFSTSGRLGDITGRPNDADLGRRGRTGNGSAAGVRISRLRSSLTRRRGWAAPVPRRKGRQGAIARAHNE